MAVGVYGMGVTLAPSFGPFFGGLAIDAFTWRHIFVAPMPLVMVAFAIGLLLMPPKGSRISLPPFNWTGYILVWMALMCIMSYIGNGHRWGWLSDRSMLFLVVGASTAVLFVYTQWQSKSPLTDVTPFTPEVYGGYVHWLCLWGWKLCHKLCNPSFVQTVQGFTPTEAGHRASGYRADRARAVSGSLAIDTVPLSDDDGV